MKKIRLISGILALAVLTTVSVSAQTLPQTTITGSQITVTPTSATTPTTSTTPQNLMAKQRTSADNELDRRITALTKITARIANLKNLTADQKTVYTSQVQQEITTLTTLKAKIDADTDEATLKTDKQSIVTGYRVFAVYLPQLAMLLAIDSWDTTTMKLSSVSAKLQTRLQEGQPTATLQATLTDMNTKISQANAQLQTAQTNILPLTPSGYPGNVSILKSARGMLQTAAISINAARKDAQTIVDALKAQGGTGTTTGGVASGGATVTQTPLGTTPTATGAAQ